MQDRRVVLENDRLVFLAEDVQNFFFFCDAGERLIDDLQRIKRLGSSVELADPTVNENQPRKRFFFFLQRAIPPSMRIRLGRGFFSSCNRRYRRVTASRMLAKSSFFEMGILAMGKGSFGAGSFGNGLIEFSPRPSSPRIMNLR